MDRLWLALLVALVAVPLASAGTETDPEIADPRGDAPSAATDILAIWLEDDPRGVRFTFLVASLPAPRDGHLYEIGWWTAASLGATESVAIGWDFNGALRSSVDTPNGWGAGGTRLDDALLDESFRPGSPARLSAVIPRERFGFDNGTIIRGIDGRSTYFDDRERDFLLGVDQTDTASYTVGDGRGFFPIIVPRWVIPAIVVACALAGAGGGFAVVRWRRAKAHPPSSPQPPTSPSSSEPYAMRKRP